MAASVDDPYDLERFVRAQQPVYARVRAELSAGCKLSHWMWFVFPQLKGLGASSTAQQYAVASLAEARAYLAHPLLGARLRECTVLLNRFEGRSAQAIFGYPDCLKFRSSMTLFERAAGAGAQPFSTALTKYFAGEGDPLTRELLAVD